MRFVRVLGMVLVGLVGLHVVQKTKQLPQWMWATFEHVDNAPDSALGPVADIQYNFFDAECSGLICAIRD